MFKFLKKLWRDRRGNALVIAAASLPLIIGSAGLATDTIEWTLLKRQLQRSADSAALAGVYGKLASQTVTTGDCTSSTTNPAISRDLAIGTVSSRINTTLTCTVQSPPSSGSWTSGSWQAVRVNLSAQRQLAFSGLFLSSPMTISATATAAYVQTGKYCMVSLDNNAEAGIDFTGNPTVNLGCGMKTNAKGAGALDCGGNARITATPVAAVGQITVCDNFGPGTTFQNYAPPQTDPFGTVNVDATQMKCAGHWVSNGNGNGGGNGNGNGNSQTWVYDALDATTNMQTARAQDGSVANCWTSLSVGSSTSLTVPSGWNGPIYINGGNVNFQGNFTCAACTIVLTNSDPSSTATIGSVDMNSTAAVNIKAPTTGTFANIAIYQDRRASSCGGNWCNQINGASGSLIKGAIYMPNQNVKMNGNSGFNTNCLQIVAWRIQFAGTTGVSNTCDDGGNGNTFDGYMVRLVE